MNFNHKTCGRVTPHHEIRLVDDYDIPVPSGAVGELIVRADIPWIINAVPGL
jgi:carnitine-CoA ligase